MLQAGCWTPPNANVQPKGAPGLIQSGIVVKSVKRPVTVQSIDISQNTISLQFTNGTTANCKLSPDFNRYVLPNQGDQVDATINLELDVYLLADGRLPDGTTAESLGVNARVLLVDPSYRLLTLQYPDGTSETFKPGVDTKLEGMAPGDSVVVRPVEVTAVKIEKH